MATKKASQNGYAERHSTRSRYGTQVLNSAFVGSGALGAGDRGGLQAVALHDSNPYSSNDYVYRWRQYVMLYETSWEARKIIRIPVEDALRKPWVVEGLDEKAQRNIENKLVELRFHDVLKRSLMLERLLGGCLTFMGLTARDDDPGKEYNPKEGADLCFLNAIPISRIARLSWCTDPMSEHYMRPDMYQINGNDVHVSRCLVWDGEPLFDPYDYALTNFRANLAGFGPSKLAPIWDDIVKAVGTRQAAYQLIQTNNAILMAVQDLQDLSGTTSGQKALAKLKEIANNISVYRAALIDGEKVDIKQSAASFGSVPELLMAFLQVLSAASDIPATRFLGQAPGGLNATGESDLENYYNMIDAYQRQRIEPNIRRVYDVVGYSMYGALWRNLRADMKFVFPPLWNTKEGEQADVASKRIDNALKLWSERAMSDEKFCEEINAQGALSVTLDKDDIALMGEAKEMLGGEEIDAKEEIGKLRNMVQGHRVENSDHGFDMWVVTWTSPDSGGTKTRHEKEYLADSKEDALKQWRDERGHLSYHDDEVVVSVKATKTFNASADRVQIEMMIQDAGYDPSQFDAEQFWRGYRVEQEHADVTKGDPVKTAKIVLAHLTELPDYYDRLEKMENQRIHNYSTYEQMEHEERTHGLLPRGGDNAYDGRMKCIKCGTKEKVIVWEGVNAIAPLCDHCWAKMNREARSQRTRFPNQKPSAAQIAAGNYKKEHLVLHGLGISIENPAGSTREGTDELGRAWSVTMRNPYGYIKGYIGADKDHIDLFLGPDTENGRVVVIDQLNLKTGSFDEHKVMFGFPTQAHALKAYLDHYDETGLERVGTLNPAILIEEFKLWLDGVDVTDNNTPFTQKPFAACGRSY